MLLDTIEIYRSGSGDGVLVAEIHPTSDNDTYFFAENFIWRLVVWFRSDLAAINIQFRDAVTAQSRNKNAHGTIEY